MNNIPELIKTKPEMFDYPDCSDAEFVEPTESEGFEHLPDDLKQALVAAKSKKESQNKAH
jgi:hypothetical protein